MSEETSVRLRCNGRDVELHVDPAALAVDVLREELGLASVRVSCDDSVCGTCVVLVDGRALATCSLFAFRLDGTIVETVEALADADGRLGPTQRAFAEREVFQCGFCAPGIIMTTEGLRRDDITCSRRKLQEALSGHVCRCTGYASIVEAMESILVHADGG